MVGTMPLLGYPAMDGQAMAIGTAMPAHALPQSQQPQPQLPTAAFAMTAGVDVGTTSTACCAGGCPVVEWNTIAVPVDVTPPEGAIPIMSASMDLAQGAGVLHQSVEPPPEIAGDGNEAGGLAADGTWYPPQQLAKSEASPRKRGSKAFKIVNPRTKEEVKASSKAMAIVDPKTGEAILLGSSLPVPAG